MNIVRGREKNDRRAGISQSSHSSLRRHVELFEFTNYPALRKPIGVQHYCGTRVFSLLRTTTFDFRLLRFSLDLGKSIDPALNVNSRFYRRDTGILPSYGHRQFGPFSTFFFIEARILSDLLAPTSSSLTRGDSPREASTLNPRRAYIPRSRATIIETFLRLLPSSYYVEGGLRLHFYVSLHHSFTVHIYLRGFVLTPLKVVIISPRIGERFHRISGIPPGSKADETFLTKFITRPHAVLANY